MSVSSVHVLSSIGDLRERYREPSRLVQNKVKASLDPMSVGFLARSTFLVIATSNGSGRLDVSPRGGPPGFVRLLDSGAIAIPDLNGNNLIDTLGNIVETGQAGCLFVVPGRDETLRVNGPAHVSVDPALLSSFDDQLRTPKTVIVIEPVEVFVHCAKSFVAVACGIRQPGRGRAMALPTLLTSLAVSSNWTTAARRFVRAWRPVTPPNSRPTSPPQHPDVGPLRCCPGSAHVHWVGSRAHMRQSRPNALS